MRVSRRTLLAAVPGLAVAGVPLLAACGGTPVAAPPAAPPRTYRVGYLSKAGSHSVPYFESFRRGLRDQGFVEGHNLSIEYRFAEGADDQLRDLAADLVAQKVDLIVARCMPESKAAAQASDRVPVVMIALTGDPVRAGIVQSYARPATNLTGLTILAPELGGKRIDLLTEAFPKLGRVAVLYNAAIPENAADLSHMRAAAERLGVTLEMAELKGPDQLDRALATIESARPDAFTTLMGTLGTTERARIVRLQDGARIPALYEVREFVEAGGMMSYGPDLRDLYARAAAYVARILRGTPPADLPVERPSRFELVISRKSARSLGVDLPPSFLGQASEIVA